MLHTPSRFHSLLSRGLVALALITALAAAPASAKVYELRTYHAAEGKLEALQARFRDHTVGLFAKHGLEVIGFWVPQEQPEGEPKQLIYLLAFESNEQRQAAWRAFVGDPEWKKVRAESIKWLADSKYR